MIMRHLIIGLYVLVLAAPSYVTGQPAPYSMLDPKPYNPETDPNIDMFMSHWNESSPQLLHGALVERVIFTPLEGDPLKPARRGAVLISIKKLSHALLNADTTTPPITLKGEQEIFCIDSGQGTITAGGKTIGLHNGVIVLVPPDLEYVMKNTGGDPLGMYVIVEPIPEGFVPKKGLVTRDDNLEPLGGTTGHWCHITKAVFTKEDGLASLTGLCPVWFDPMTMGQPHSHGVGVEEIWFSLEGESTILLGKQLRAFPPGTAYKIPPNGTTPHSTINVTDKPFKVFWMMKNVAYEPPPYSMLDPKPYDPATDPDIDMYMGSWLQSMPVKTHGALVERDILTRGDPENPPVKGAVLSYAGRFTRASLGARETTAPVTLSGEQEIFYVLSGRGKISAGKKTAELRPGIAVLMPPGIEFTLENTGDETLTMYLIADPCPDGFKPLREMTVVDENIQKWNTENPHWVGLSKTLFGTGSGLGTLSTVLTVQLEPMTFFHPHSHGEGIEEVWTGISGDIYVLLGKQIRHQEPGTAYLIPPNGTTPHGNFNVSGDRIKLLYFSRFPQQ